MIFKSIIPILQKVHDDLVIQEKTPEYNHSAGMCWRVGNTKFSTLYREQTLKYMDAHRPISTQSNGEYWWDLKDYKSRIDWLDLHIRMLTEIVNKKPIEYTMETLPNNCPECGNKLRHKMSGRVCDNYPCTWYYRL